MPGDVHWGRCVNAPNHRWAGRTTSEAKASRVELIALTLSLRVVFGKGIGRRLEAWADGTPRDEGSKSFGMYITRLRLNASGTGEPKRMSKQALWSTVWPGTPVATQTP